MLDFLHWLLVSVIVLLWSMDYGVLGNGGGRCFNTLSAHEDCVSDSGHERSRIFYPSYNFAQEVSTMTMSVKLSKMASYALGVVLLASGVSASMSGPGHIYPKYEGAYVGCLDEYMRWVVDGDCGVFTAKTVTSFGGKCFWRFVVETITAVDDAYLLFLW